MNRDESTTAFTADQAANYDEQFAKLSALSDALRLLASAVLADLPADARMLCVGAGTGTEVVALAQRFPGWSFVAVEPSGPMLDVCRRRLAECGLQARCECHEGFLDSLPQAEPFDGATSLLVSHFLVDAAMRREYFRTIARHLRPGGRLVNADLSSPPAAGCELHDIWFRLMRFADVTAEQIEGMRQAYDSRVALLPPEELSELIQSAGFTKPIQFLQTGLIHACCAVRTA